MQKSNTTTYFYVTHALQQHLKGKDHANMSGGGKYFISRQVHDCMLGKCDSQILHCILIFLKKAGPYYQKIRI